MAAEILSDLSRATDSNSSPLSGAKWYFYATGGLTPQSVYTTAALSVEHANPVVADSAGLFAAIYFDATLQYRGILKDADGNTIRDIDPINGGLASQLALSTGSTLVKKGEASLSAITPVTPQQFGADAGGTVVDTTAAASMLTAIGTYSGDLGKAGYLPSGLYPLDATLTPQSYTRVYGDGPHQSVLRNDVAPIPTIPAFTAAALTFTTFEDIGARGQKSFAQITGDTDHLLFRNIFATGMGEAGLNISGMLQTSVLDRFVVESSPKGIICSNVVCNRNTIREPEFKDLTDDHVTLAGSEDLLIVGPRHEGAIAAGKAAYRLTGAQHINVFGGYFESGAEYDVAWSSTPSGLVSFNGTHFTHYTALVPHLTSVAAGGRISYTNCHSTIKKYVPDGSILMGINENIQVTQGGASFSKYGPRGGQVDLKGIKTTATSSTITFLTFTRPLGSTAATNQQSVSGKLMVMVSGYGDGGFPHVMTSEYRVVVKGARNDSCVLEFSLIGSADDMTTPFTITPSGINASTTKIDLQVAVTGLVAAENIVSASFEWSGHSYTEGAEFVVTAP